MPSQPHQITVTLTQAQTDILEKLKKLTGTDTTYIIRTALTELYQKIQNDEEANALAKINALLDVQ